MSACMHMHIHALLLDEHTHLAPWQPSSLRRGTRLLTSPATTRWRQRLKSTRRRAAKQSNQASSHWRAPARAACTRVGVVTGNPGLAHSATTDAFVAFRTRWVSGIPTCSSVLQWVLNTEAMDSRRTPSLTRPSQPVSCSPSTPWGWKGCSFAPNTALSLSPFLQAPSPLFSCVFARKSQVLVD